MIGSSGKKSIRLLFLLAIVSSLLSACGGMPKGVQPVNNFDINRYLGKWYEISRLDHSFERGLSDVTADYSLRDDGGIKVINRGFNSATNKWKTAEGKAYFVDNKNQGYFEVSFFGPFYSSYVVFELDMENYQYAFISGYNNSYLWLLSRSPNIDQKIIDRFVDTAKKLGFHTENLIFVTHKNASNPNQ